MKQLFGICTTHHVHDVVSVERFKTPIGERLDEESRRIILRHMTDVGGQWLVTFTDGSEQILLGTQIALAVA